MRSISRHIRPLVINRLGHGHSHTHTHTRIPTVYTGSILRNQAHTGHRPGVPGLKMNWFRLPKFEKWYKLVPKTVS